MKRLLRKGFKGEKTAFTVETKELEEDSDDVFGDGGASDDDDNAGDDDDAPLEIAGSESDKIHKAESTTSSTAAAASVALVASKKKAKKSKKKLKSYEKFQQAQEKRGVVYLARIPPYMKPAKVQHLLEQYGKVTNLHCVEEDRSLRRRRKKAGGNSKKNYVEGWIEYENKKIAKNVARCLNNTQIGGKKTSYYYHDIWNMKYLRGFKWRHLTENPKTPKPHRFEFQIHKYILCFYLFHNLHK